MLDTTMPAPPAANDVVDETALVRAAAAGDTAAYEQLYRQHAPRVFATLWLLCGGQQARAEDGGGEDEGADPRAELARRLEEDDYPTPFAGLDDWHLLRALAIHRPELAAPYVHLVDQEPFDED